MPRLRHRVFQSRVLGATALVARYRGPDSAMLRRAFRFSRGCAWLCACCRPIGKMNVDEFMAKGFLGSLDGESDSDLDLDDGNSDADDADDDGGAKAPGERSATSVDAFMAGALDDSASDEDPAGEARGSEESEEGSDIEELEGEVDRHQASLERLKAAQPEFYKFLQENDKVRRRSPWLSSAQISRHWPYLLLHHEEKSLMSEVEFTTRDGT